MLANTQLQFRYRMRILPILEAFLFNLTMQLDNFVTRLYVRYPLRHRVTAFRYPSDIHTFTLYFRLLSEIVFVQKKQPSYSYSAAMYMRALNFSCKSRLFKVSRRDVAASPKLPDHSSACQTRHSPLAVRRPAPPTSVYRDERRGRDGRDSPGPASVV